MNWKLKTDVKELIREGRFCKINWAIEQKFYLLQ